MPKVALLLTDGFADWEYALIAGTGGPFYGLEVGFFAPAAGNLRSQGGLQVQVPSGFDEVQVWQPDVVVVVGGMIWESGNALDISEMLAALKRLGVAVAGICGGTLALARAGLLEDVRHTSNDQGFLIKNAAGYGGSAHFEDTPSAVSDRAVITAPGTAPVSFAAEVFRAAGVEPAAVTQFTTMLAAEHGSGV
ncbi:DJ-1/PfpI family protein [Roseibium sp. RKSG952]|uniref:DJ-1/PfpI family protein n=1 Tax=Roseibium sp. RKSG952 TaxID=2529384 RepID=UPI0012BC48BF|nr:DJ-1/PfpI family protein [Roseibium sp. RKSG952]MTH96870.1 glutamine amidotransferase [Roseibium sp. RKSG952]